MSDTELSTMTREEEHRIFKKSPGAQLLLQDELVLGSHASPDSVQVWRVVPVIRYALLHLAS